MPKLCKRIIALLLAFCLVGSLFFSAFAVSSENQATFWEAWLASLAGANDSLVFSDGWWITDWGSNFLSHDTVCPLSSDGYHHGSQVDGLVDGRAKVKCSECGQWFYYSASDLQNQYNNYLHDNNLDNNTPVPVTTSSVPFSGHWKRDCPYLVTASDRDKVIITLNGREFKKYDSLTYIFTAWDNSGTSDTWTCYKFVLADNDSYSVDYKSPSSYMYKKCFRFYYDVGGSFQSGSMTSINNIIYAPLSYSKLIEDWYVFDSIDYPAIYVPSTITVDNINYNVTSCDFSSRIYFLQDNKKIEYGDTEIKIYEGDTVVQTINYIIENDDPGTAPGNGDDSSTPSDPGTVDPGDASGSGGSGCCEQCALLLRQVNSYLLQIQTLVDQINDKLGPESDNYMEGIYNLLVEINTALDNLPTEPHKDYEAKLTTISNQLANIWGDLETIKTSLSAVQTNTATTNQKLDTVHADLQAVLAELQTQRGILSQILSVLQDLLRHVTSIDANVEDLQTEEQKENFVTTFIGKFAFINDVYRITVQMMRDVTNDAVSAQAVSDGIIPASVLSAGHAPEDDSQSQSVDNVADSSLSLQSGPSNPTAPEVVTRFPDHEVLGFNLSQFSVIDMSWYAPYKSEIDSILSGFMYLGYIWLLFKKLPGIIQGAAMATDAQYDIEKHGSDATARAAHYGLIGGDDLPF